MRIGILTFHAQQNYGGVLQCFALKAALEGLGHEVVVVDKWSDSEHAALRRELVRFTTRDWLFCVRNSLAGCGDFRLVLRTLRFVRFVTHLGLTKYHFLDWNEAPQDLDLDLLVVGSDQVWHCGDWGNPAPYLLENAGSKVPRAISYAASFGMKSLPEDYREQYKRGLARFAAISCREKEGCEICRDLGFDAAHVVDPTLLADRSCWNKLLPRVFRLSRVRRTLVCYFMSVDVDEALPRLEAFACARNCRVLVITAVPQGPRAYPTSLKEWAANYHRAFPHVRMAVDSGPKEFVRAFASATWTLTDSFHAVMFSSIFKTNLRFIKPDSALRQTMFARIEEFAASCMKGPVFVDSVQAALDSFSRDETVVYHTAEIESRRTASLEWLKGAIG